MKFSIFTKLFFVYTIFTLVPLIISAGLIVISYEKALNGFLSEKSLSEVATISQELFSTLTELKLQLIVLVAIIAFLSVLSSFLATRNLVTSLRTIMSGIKEVGSGNLDFKIDSNSKDELGESAKYFNDMTGRLKKARLAMQEAKDTLKIKVDDKTKELEELVKNRDLTIKEKTRELQDRVDELEKVHRLSVGRELKMAELKKELQLLREKLKKPKNESGKLSS